MSENQITNTQALKSALGFPLAGLGLWLLGAILIVSVGDDVDGILEYLILALTTVGGVITLLGAYNASKTTARSPLKMAYYFGAALALIGTIAPNGGLWTDASTVDITIEAVALLGMAIAAGAAVMMRKEASHALASRVDA